MELILNKRIISRIWRLDGKQQYIKTKIKIVKIIGLNFERSIKSAFKK